MGPAPDGAASAGFFLSLLTESFAVRALLGSVVASSLGAIALHRRWVVAPRTRRLVVLAPIIAATAAAAASVVEAETYLPQLWITSSGGPSGQVLELLGELRVVSPDRGMNLLVVLWCLVLFVLLCRRLWGVAATRLLLHQAEPLDDHHPLQRTADQLAPTMRATRVRVHLLQDCPGGAFTTRTRRPVVVLDPVLVAALDEQESEGLIAHELAHVARRDTLLAAGVGIVCDVLFFLPTVRLVGRWLRREREESADELASLHTRRPAALASSILKVFEGASPAAASLAACSAVPALRGSRRRGHGGLQLSGGALVVAARVERLVAPPAVLSGARQALEILLAALVIVATSVATLVIPQWLATEMDAYSFAIGYVPPPAQPVESAAFSTFRALAPVATPAVEGARGFERAFARPVRGEEGSLGCPCVETQAQWLAGVPAELPGSNGTMSWRRSSNPTWDVEPPSGSVRARPLLTLPEAGPQVGFFVVGRTAP